MNNKSFKLLSDTEKFNWFIQLLVAGYLKRKKMPPMSVILEKSNLENKPGVIYGCHIEYVQILMTEELSLIDKNLKEEIKKNNEEFKVGQLSNYEKKYLTNKIENLMGVVEVIFEKEIMK